MKVNAIENSKTIVVQKFQKTNKKDLTSFGMNQPKSEIDVKKADDAIKTNFLSNVSFKGRTINVDARYSMVGTSGKIYYSKPYSHESSEQIGEILDRNTEAFPNTSIQEKKRVNPDSQNPLCIMKVYIADPQEGISKEIKENHDFILYDNEPKFPLLDNLRRKYTDTYGDHTDYHQYCKTIFDYHERLKSADINTLIKLEDEKVTFEKEFEKSLKYKQRFEESTVENPWGKASEQKAKAQYFHDGNDKMLQKNRDDINYYKARIEHSKGQQALATELYNILNESGELFIKRDELQKEIRGMQHYTEPGKYYSSYFSHIEEIDPVIEKHRGIASELEQTLNTTKSWYDLRGKESQNLRSENDKQDAEKELKILKRKIDVLEYELKIENKFIETMEALPEKYNSLISTSKLVLRKLKQNFIKVEKFYAANAARLICH